MKSLSAVGSARDLYFRAGVNQSGSQTLASSSSLFLVKLS